MNQVIERLDATNRAIVENAMQAHDKHYLALCQWIIHRARRSKRRLNGPSDLGEMLGEGHTVACAIWEEYTFDPKKAKS